MRIGRPATMPHLSEPVEYCIISFDCLPGFVQLGAQYALLQTRVEYEILPG
jgi:hypothetical protein